MKMNKNSGRFCLLLLVSLVSLRATWAADLSRGWKVLRGADFARHSNGELTAPTALPPANAKWVDLETSRSRAYRLTNFYEPGLPIWLERTVNLSAADIKGSWIVSVPNRMMIERAFLNGQPIKDVAAIQNNKEVMTPEMRAIYDADPYKTDVWHTGISVRGGVRGIINSGTSQPCCSLTAKR
jgi:hypothetical protein